MVLLMGRCSSIISVASSNLSSRFLGELMFITASTYERMDPAERLELTDVASLTLFCVAVGFRTFAFVELFEL